MIGLACAWRAAQRGARVAVLERARPPAGATSVAAGMLAPVGELTFGEPELLGMTLAAAALYPGFVAELEAASGPSTGYRARAPCTSRSTATRRRSCAASTTCSASSASRPSGCRRAAAASWSRASRPSFHGGVFAPGEASVDPRALAAALVAALRAAGGELRTGARSSTASSSGDRLVGRAHRGAARSCAPTPSSSPAAPGRGRPSGCPSTRGRRCGR